MTSKRTIGLTIGLFLPTAVWAADLGTAFTYQGYLENPAGTPVNGLCDFEFGLWKDPTSTIALDKVGPTLTFNGMNAVPVTNGLFTIPGAPGPTLDFGHDAIDGTARWLEIKVCCPSGCDPTTLTLLTPRVDLRPVPHALALPGLYTRQTAMETTPNIIGGYEGNQVGALAEGATIGGGGASITGPFGYCVFSPGVLCDEDADCGTSGPCLADPSVGRCDDDGALCNTSTPCATGVCVPPLSRNLATAHFATVGGGFGNQAGGGESGLGSTVGGGGDNNADGPFSTIGGGQNNTAAGPHAVVAGGSENDGTGEFATVGGGKVNSATGRLATASGGSSNSATADFATVGGGVGNKASGSESVVPGGEMNEAGGHLSFAAGYRAKVRTPAQSVDSNGDEGTFVWADSTNANFTSTGPDQFLIRAAGGVGINTNSPDAALDVVGDILTSGSVAIGDQTPDAALDVETTSDSGGSNTADFYAPNIGPIKSHIHYGLNGDWYIRSANPAGKVVLQDTGGSVGIGTSTPDVDLHVISDPTLDDAEPGSGGYIVAGSINGPNIAIDNNEIMARNNDATSTLYLNNDGGNVVFGGGDVVFGGSIRIGYEVVNQPIVLSGSADCPAGKVVLGGGCRCGGMIMKLSAPAEDGTAWICNCDAIAVNQIAYAICARVE